MFHPGFDIENIEKYVRFQQPLEPVFLRIRIGVFQVYDGKHSETGNKSRGIILEKDDLFVYLFVLLHVPETDNVFTFIEFLGPSWLCMVHLSEVLLFEHKRNPVMIEVNILHEFFHHLGYSRDAVAYRFHNLFLLL